MPIFVFDEVESNPGPNINGIGIYENSKYEIIGLKESFFAICYSAQKSVSVWEKRDIDFILQYQNDNFGCIPGNRHFSVDELPKFVKIHDHIFKVQNIWHHVNVFKNISDLFVYHNTLTTCDIGDDAVLIYNRNFLSEQVVPYGSGEYSIVYFKVSPPGIDKIDSVTINSTQTK